MVWVYLRIDVMIIARFSGGCRRHLNSPVLLEKLIKGSHLSGWRATIFSARRYFKSHLGLTIGGPSALATNSRRLPLLGALSRKAKTIGYDLVSQKVSLQWNIKF
jgi:hypothetical protein